MSHQGFLDAVAKQDLVAAEAIAARFEAAMAGTIVIGNDGKASIPSFDAARAAFLELAEPSRSADVDRALRLFGLGVAYKGGKPIAPWGMFVGDNAALLSPSVLQQVVGQPEPSTSRPRKRKPFASYSEAPVRVVAPANLAVLSALARPESETSMSAAVASADWVSPAFREASAAGVTEGRITRNVRRRAAAGGTAAPVAPAAPADSTPPPPPPAPDPQADAVATTTQALSAADAASVLDAAKCLGNADWGASDAWIVSICIPVACAEAIFDALKKALMPIAAAAVAALIAKGTVTAAVAAAGGWVTAGIAAGAAYWALWIGIQLAEAKKQNKQGICLKVPTPLTLGLIGPGWVSIW